jgi:hypothetical protein
LARRCPSRTLLDPVLELHDSFAGIIAENDNWQSSPDKQAIIDHRLPADKRQRVSDCGDAESRGLHGHPFGANGEAGVALVEVYDLT